MAGAVDYQPGIPAGMTQTSVADCIINVSYKEAADQIFAHVCKEAGMLEEFSYLMYEGVNKLGFIGLGEERPVLTAP